MRTMEDCEQWVAMKRCQHWVPFRSGLTLTADGLARTSYEQMTRGVDEMTFETMQTIRGHCSDRVCESRSVSGLCLLLELGTASCMSC